MACDVTSRAELTRTMDRYLPTWKGTAAVALSFLALLLLPAMAPARSNHTSQFTEPVAPQVWAVLSVVVFFCIVANVLALRGRRPDRVAAGVGFILTLLGIWGFVSGSIQV